MEHLTRPYAALQAMASVQTSGGVLLVEMPEYLAPLGAWHRSTKDYRGRRFCPVERYGDGRGRPRMGWSGHLTISDGSEPDRRRWRTGCAKISQWLDAVLAWRYVVPGTDSRDRKVLRPICAALAAARCWTALVGRNPGQEARPQELESDGLSKLVYNPGGTGSRLKGTASLVVTNRSAIMGGRI